MSPRSGEVTLIVHTDDGIMEFTGPIPPGEVGRGYFNLMGRTGFHGHLRHERCAGLAFMERPFMGRLSASIVFFNVDGGIMFKVFVGRDEKRELLADQLAKFRALAQRVERETPDRASFRAAEARNRSVSCTRSRSGPGACSRATTRNEVYFPLMCCGSQSASSGQTITIASTTNMIRWNGIVPYTTSRQLAVPDALDHEQVDADRRRDLPELDVDHQDHAEQDRIDAVAAEDRIEQRHRDDDHAEAFDQAAEHGEQREQHQIELQLATAACRR